MQADHKVEAPSAERAFLYYKFYYQATISVQVKPRALSREATPPQSGFGNPSVSCAFLYYKFYYKGTISVPSKPRPL